MLSVLYNGCLRSLPKLRWVRERATARPPRANPRVAKPTGPAIVQLFLPTSFYQSTPSVRSAS